MIGMFALFGLFHSGSAINTVRDLRSTLPGRSESTNPHHPTSESGGIQSSLRALSVGLSELTFSKTHSQTP